MFLGRCRRYTNIRSIEPAKKNDHFSLFLLFQGWQYSAAMFVALNAIALTFICYAYYRMFQEIKSSGLALRSTQERQEKVVAYRFGIIIFTDCICWIPIIIFKLVALAGMFLSFFLI